MRGGERGIKDVELIDTPMKSPEHLVMGMQVFPDDGRDRLRGVCLGVNGLLAVSGDSLKPPIDIVTNVGGGIRMLSTREYGNNVVPASIAEIRRANGVTGAEIGADSPFDSRTTNGKSGGIPADLPFLRRVMRV